MLAFDCAQVLEEAQRREVDSIGSDRQMLANDAHVLQRNQFVDAHRPDAIIRTTTTQPSSSRAFGFGLDVSVSRPSRDELTSPLGLVSDKVHNVSVSELCVSGLVSVSAQKVSAFRLAVTLCAGARHA